MAYNKHVPAGEIYQQVCVGGGVVNHMAEWTGKKEVDHDQRTRKYNFQIGSLDIREREVAQEEKMAKHGDVQSPYIVHYIEFPHPRILFLLFLSLSGKSFCENCQPRSCLGWVGGVCVCVSASPE